MGQKTKTQGTRPQGVPGGKDPRSPEYRLGVRDHRVTPVQVRRVDGNYRALTFTASTGDVARDGDIIDPAGWQVADYLKNPVVLWSHNPEIPPIGKGLAVRVLDDRLEVDVEFDVDEFADRILGLYERGFLNAVSVGFRPTAWREPDQDEKNELGLGPWGVIWTKTELYELSAVSVPADPGALIQNSITAEERGALSVLRGMSPVEHRARFDPFLRDTEEETPTEGTVEDDAAGQDHSDHETTDEDDLRAVDGLLAARLAQTSPASRPVSEDRDILNALMGRSES